MNSSTAWPALTISMTRRGFLSRPTISSMEWAPMTLVPLASLVEESSTLETVRLKATTVNPWSFMLRIRFWPITASPITAISALGSMLVYVYSAKRYKSAGIAPEITQASPADPPQV